jgi:CheY-like chemotaxis protein
VPSSGSSAQRVLIAGTERCLRLVAGALDGDGHILTARSLREALEQLKAHAPFDYVVCNTRFDESRMFDFLEALRVAALVPAPRVVCVHSEDPPLSPRGRVAIEAALEALGVQALVDFPDITAARGELVARQVLRMTILAKL